MYAPDPRDTIRPEQNYLSGVMPGNDGVDAALYGDPMPRKFAPLSHRRQDTITQGVASLHLDPKLHGLQPPLSLNTLVTTSAAENIPSIDDENLEMAVRYARITIQQGLLATYQEHLLTAYTDVKKQCQPDNGASVSHSLQAYRSRAASVNWAQIFGRIRESFDGFEPLVPVLSSLSIGEIQTMGNESYRARRTVSADHGPGSNVRTPTMEGGKVEEALNALGFLPTADAIGLWHGGVYLDAIYDPLDGVMVLMDRKTFGDVGRPDANPQLEAISEGRGSAFSEVVINAWDNCHRLKLSTAPPPSRSVWEGLWKKYNIVDINGTELKRMRSWLNYVVVTNIRHPSDLSIIRRCLHSRRAGPDGLGDFPTWDDPFFPRQTFTLGTWCFYALLSMQCFEDIVWTLINGKRTFGHKVIRSATIFQPTQQIMPGSGSKGYHSMTERPALLLEIVDFNTNHITDSERWVPLQKHALDPYGPFPNSDWQSIPIVHPPT